MKRISKLVMSLSLALVAILVVSGCNDSGLFARLERTVNASANNVDSLDHVAAEDMSDTNLSPFSSYSVNQTFVNLGIGDNLDKIETVIDLFQDIKDQQEIINQLKTTVKVNIQDLKNNVKAFKEAALELTEEEKATIEGYISEIKAENEQLKDTIGKVYLKMRNLRGRYSLSSLDNNIEVLTQVKEAITIRAESATRISEIIVEINTVLASKLG